MEAYEEEETPENHALVMEGRRRRLEELCKKFEVETRIEHSSLFHRWQHFKKGQSFKTWVQVRTDQPLHREVLQVPRERLLHLQRSEGRVNIMELLLWREQHHSSFHRGLSRKWNLPQKVRTSVTSGFHSQVRF